MTRASKRAPSQIETWARTSLRDVLRFQWSKLTQDSRTPVLWIIELLLGVGIGASIAIYLDPDINVIPFPSNVVVFAALVGMALWIHRRTRPFRVAQKITKKRAKEA